MNNHMRTLKYMAAKLYAFLRAESGLAAIEFALSLPLMVALLLGSSEICMLLIKQEKSERIATTISDLVAQEKTLTTNQLNDILLAAGQEMLPFNFGEYGMVIITSVTQTGDPSISNPPKISWQYVGGGNYQNISRVGNVGNPASLPAGFTLQVGDNIIVTEVFYKNVALFTSSPSTFKLPTTLYSLAVAKPRLGTLSTPPS